MSQRASIELETDRREPHPSTLGKLAIALGVELLKLLEDLSSADVISNALSKHLSSGYHNPVATPGISRQLKASYPEKIQLRRAQWQPTALYGRQREVSENHWCPRFESGFRHCGVRSIYFESVEKHLSGA
jgi:transcriptional regulator with XRE-family HTH domain